MDDDERTTNPNKTVVTVVADATDKVEGRGYACLVVIYGDDLGRRFPLKNDNTTIGRSSRSDLQLDQESVSRSHASISRRDERYRIRDLGSTNGTYVNDDFADEIELRDGDQVKIGRTILKFLAGGNMEAQYHEVIYRLMTTDGLTSLHNKRFFAEALEKEVSRAKRYERSFSLILLDIDHFKTINDTYGHLAGDAVLSQVGYLIGSRIRRDDIAARTGGEEMAVILPEVATEGAVKLAENLRRAVESTKFRFEAIDIRVTISLGVAEWDARFGDAADIIKAADEKLYEAKKAGRNRVRAHEAPPPLRAEREPAGPEAGSVDGAPESHAAESASPAGDEDERDDPPTIAPARDASSSHDR